MRHLLAAFDPSQHQRDGTYWTWRNPDLPLKLLDRFYYEIAARHQPTCVAQIAPEDIVGGYAVVDDRWLCVYRFVNGGRDSQGRPGRFILLCAFILRSDARLSDPIAVLDGAIFQRLAQAAPGSRPLPPPPSLVIELDVPLTEADPAFLASAETGGRFEVTGPEAIRRASAVCAQIRNGLDFDCQFTRRAGLEEAWISVRNSPADHVAPPDAKQPVPDTVTATSPNMTPSEGPAISGRASTNDKSGWLTYFPLIAAAGLAFAIVAIYWGVHWNSPPPEGVGSPRRATSIKSDSPTTSGRSGRTPSTKPTKTTQPATPTPARAGT